MKTILILAIIAFAVVCMITLRNSSPANTDVCPTDGQESVTDEPSTPLPGPEQARREPFVSYDPGPAEALWKYEQLTPGEKAVADRGRLQPGWTAIHDVYRSAVIQRSTQAAASAAQHQLGIDNLASIGVVP
jgi:hypothetical protein